MSSSSLAHLNPNGQAVQSPGWAACPTPTSELWATLGAVATQPTAEQRDEILMLADLGYSVNRITALTGFHRSTVGIVMREGGLEVRLERTRNAARTRQADNQLRRAEIMSTALDDAKRVQEQLWQQVEYFNFGGRDNTFASQEVTEPTAADKLKIAQTVQTLVNVATKLAEFDAGNNRETIDLISATAEALGLVNDGD